MPLGPDQRAGQPALVVHAGGVLRSAALEIGNGLVRGGRVQHYVAEIGFVDDVQRVHRPIHVDALTTGGQTDDGEDDRDGPENRGHFLPHICS